MSRRQVLRLAGAAAITAPLAAAFPSSASPEARAAALAPDTAGCGNVIFRDHFAEGTSDNWSVPKFIEGNGAIDFVPDPLDPSTLVARFTVPDDQVSFRAEMGEHQFDFGRSRWEVSHFVPTDWAPWKHGTIITQWHGYPLPDGSSTNPPVSLAIYGPKPHWYIRIFRLTGPSTVTATVYDITSPAIGFGQWNHWVFDITWSTPTTPGLLVATVDGVEAVRHEGDNNYHQRWAPHFQMGIYRSEWRPGMVYPTGLAPIVVYHKNLIVTDLRNCSTADPVGVGDHAISADGATVVLDPLANDRNAGAGSPVDPADLRLLDAAGQPVSQRSVAGEGVWALGTPVGRVVFTPDAGFLGDTTAVRYQVGYIDATAHAVTFGAAMTVTVERPPLVTSPLSVTVSGTQPTILRPLDGVHSSGTTRADPASVRIFDPSTGLPVTQLTVVGVGTFVVEADGTIRYTAEDGYEGSYRAVFEISDQFGRTHRESIELLVQDNASSTPTTSTPTTSTPTTSTPTTSTPTTSTPTTSTPTTSTPTTSTPTTSTPTTSTPTTPTPTTTTPTTTTPAVSSTSSALSSVTSSISSTPTPGPGTGATTPFGVLGAGPLAATGAGERTATIFGVGAVAVGSALVALSYRRDEPPDEPTSEQP